MDKKIKVPQGMPTIDPRKLKHHPKNVKEHTPEQVQGIVHLIKLLGWFKDPLVIDKKNLVWIGNGRLEAALILQEEGLLPEVPYLYLDHLSKDERYALMIADNKINESAWHLENTAEIIAEMPDYDWEPFQVDMDEFKPDKEVKEVEAPAPRETKIKRGDVFELGTHRLMCGDSRNEEDVKKLLNGNKPNAIITDPPYGVDYSEKQEYLNSIDPCKRITTPIQGDKIIKEYQQFTESWLKLVPLSEKNTIYIFQAGLNYHKCRMATEAQGCTWGADLIWEKNRMIFGRKDYKFQHEPVFYGWKGKHKFYGPANRTTLLKYDRPQVSDLHPTMKPITLMAQLITDGTDDKMIVYDPFSGSGSTLIACEQLNRRCFGMEIDPSYTQVIIDRWEQQTGNKAHQV